MSHPDVHRLREKILSKTVATVEFGSDGRLNFENEVEIKEGCITVRFADGSAALFTAAWHNDSTAGLYMEVCAMPEPQDRPA